MSRPFSRARSGFVATLVLACIALGAGPNPTAHGATFYNPVADAYDPTIVTDGGYYHLIGTSEDNRLTIKRATTIAGLKTAAPTVVWTGPTSGLGCCRLWSPVLQRVQGKWWIYFSVTDSSGSVGEAALYALEGNAADPMGPYTLKGAVKTWQTGDPGYWEKGIVGPAVTELPDGRLFLTTTTFGFYIDELSNPWTVKPGTSTVTIDDGTPDFAWEGQTSEIARPFVRTQGGQTKVFVPYSSETHTGNRTTGAPCWSWCIGLWTNSDGNLTNPGSWTKSSQPAFAGGPASGLYRIIALATFKSPDQTEDWIVYNANDTPGTDFGERDTFVQKFTWNADNTPNFGQPVPLGTPITVPSGESGSPTPIAPGSTLLDSTFTGGATTGWSSLAGIWSGCGAEYCATGGTDNVAVAGETRWADYVAQASVVADNAPNGSGMDLLARVTSTQDFYELELLKDAAGVRKWIIAARRNGTYDILASGTYNWLPGQRYWLRLDVNSGTLTGLISTDGHRFQLLGSARDAPGVASVTRWHDFGKVGLRTWGGLTARYDDVKVVANRPTYGFYTGTGWAGIVLDAGGSTEPNKAFCRPLFNEYCLGGQQLSTTSAINTTAAGSLPQSYYQTERWSDAAPATATTDGSFQYVIPSLQPGRGYRVVLHFAEIHFTAAGQRTFDVEINGQQVLDEFDKVAAAGGGLRSVVREFAAVADAHGHIRVRFRPGTQPGVGDHNPTVSAIEVRPLFRRINAGGAAAGDYTADGSFTGGQVLTTTNAVTTAGVADPAPATAYQSERYSWPALGDFRYTFNGLAAGAVYRLRLHFAEIHYAAINQRRFDVDVNGVKVLDDFDKVAAAGGPNKAVVREFTATADALGRVDVRFSQGAVSGVDGNPTVSALELLTG
jgi:GH43 family beta-xylosidase